MWLQVCHGWLRKGSTPTPNLGGVGGSRVLPGPHAHWRAGSLGAGLSTVLGLLRGLLLMNEPALQVSVGLKHGLCTWQKAKLIDFKYIYGYNLKLT